MSKMKIKHVVCEISTYVDRDKSVKSIIICTQKEKTDTINQDEEEEEEIKTTRKI